MPRYLPFAIVSLLVCVTLGWGGHSPWATLLLELGTVSLLLSVLLSVLWCTRPEERARNLEERRARRGLPFAVRRPRLASVSRLLSLGLFPPRAGTAEVEILLPGHGERHPDSFFFAGYEFKRAGLGVPLLLITVWMGASLLPLSETWRARLSPQASEIRMAAQGLLLDGESATVSSTTLSSFLTERGLCLWLAYIALFYVSVCLARNRRSAERLSWMLLMVGVAAGLYGIGQWLVGLQELFGADPSEVGLRARGPFGNPNHYAASMEMLLLVSVGWIGARIVGRTADGRETGVSRLATAVRQQSKAKLVLLGLGFTVICLGLVFSLSRSGIAAAVVAFAFFTVLADPRSPALGPIEVAAEQRTRYAARRFLASAFVVVGIMIWFGTGVLAQRFAGVSELWKAEVGRQRVWSDSLQAASDFWLTGSGLGTFGQIFPIYRTFGGSISYTHAHNDYLQLLIELGAPGLLLVLGLVVGVWRRAWRARRRLQGDRAALYMHAGYCSAAFAVALHSFTDFSLHLPANAALLSVIVGVVVGLDQGSKGHQSCP